MTLLLLVALNVSGAAPSTKVPLTPNGSVRLDGQAVEVHWDDGDTFKVLASGMKARLVGYNTLESYGAIHRFGPGPQALYAISSKATDLARSKVWDCKSQAGEGGYGRKAVDCPGLRRALLEAGLAHPFSVDSAAPKADLDAQNMAIQAKAGMWSAGAPKFIVTSVHSIDEKPDQTETYNRVLDVATGEAPKHKHTKKHEPCSWVCHEDSCLLYVPYSQRYGERKASCLREAP